MSRELIRAGAGKFEMYPAVLFKALTLLV